MRTTFAILLLGGTLVGVASAEPLLTSWFTSSSGRYARLFRTTADEAAGTSVTTWSQGQGVQSLPTYAGVHEIAHTDTDVYIRTTGLGFHVMGPWYLDAARTRLFPNFPANSAVIYRFPRDPGTPPATKVSTGLGAIGIFVDGVAMFDSRDAFSYVSASGRDATPVNGLGQGDGIWNRDAYVNESVTFDAANAHQAGIVHHYHANPPALRHLLGDSVDHDAGINVYTERFNGRHSPILGWVRDGHPIYGPYGYADPLDPFSGVRRMISGYQKRDGTNGSTDLAATGRTSLPAWVGLQGRSTALAASESGPDVGPDHVLGHYLEDYAFLGDLGLVQGVDFDLDAHNGRFCVTPEFPAGTYAYFVSIDGSGAPVFPYNIGATFHGDPAGEPVTAVPSDATVFFRGGPSVEPAIRSLTFDAGTGDVTLVWSGVDGGTYTVEAGDDVADWETVDAGATPVAGTGAGTTVDPGRAADAGRQFYRLVRTGIDAFDDAGFSHSGGSIPPGAGGDPFVATFEGPPLPPLGVLAGADVTVGGNGATVVSRDSERQLTLLVDATGLAAGSHPAIVRFSPPTGGTLTLTSTNGLVVP